MKYILVLVLTLCAGVSHADSATTAALDRGTYIKTAVVVGSSVTGTALIAINPLRMDGKYFNNTATAIWIGTTTATIQANHSNITMGFPVLSSATFILDGIMSGAASFTCTSGIATCEVRSYEGLNR